MGQKRVTTRIFKCQSLVKFNDNHWQTMALLGGKSDVITWRLLCYLSNIALNKAVIKIRKHFHAHNTDFT